MAQRPKLLSLNTYHYRRGGTDSVYFDHDTLFNSLGWETGSFAMRHPDNEPSEWDEFFVDELEFGVDYPWWKQLIMAGKVIYSFEARKKLERLLDTWRPDVAHVHNIYHHISPSVLGVLKQQGVPTVLTAHDLKLACPAYKMLNSGGVCEKCKNGNLIHVALNRCIHESLSLSSLIMLESTVHRMLRLYRRNLDRIVVPSGFYKKKLVEWGWPADKIVHIANFVHIENYSANYEPGDYFLYFGRLDRSKGVDTLIKAVCRSNVKLRIAGTGPFEAELKCLGEKCNGSVEFLGYCSGDTLWRLVRGARAVVLPSEWYENAPISVLEAYATGKIVIGANIGGIPELLLEGQTGCLFESGNVQCLADMLGEVIGWPDSKIEVMGKQAREFVSKTFVSQIYLSKMLRLYESLGVAVPEAQNIS